MPGRAIVSFTSRRRLAPAVPGLERMSCRFRLLHPANWSSLYRPSPRRPASNTYPGGSLFGHGRLEISHAARRFAMKFGVLIFPGSNCDHDAYWTIQQVAKQPVTFLWHESHDLENCDAIIVPGGFAYGDYLRTGAIAKFSPVMESVRKFAAE